jgi:hypothetical protein
MACKSASHLHTKQCHFHFFISFLSSFRIRASNNAMIPPTRSTPGNERRVSVTGQSYVHRHKYITCPWTTVGGTISVRCLGKDRTSYRAACHYTIARMDEWIKFQYSRRKSRKEIVRRRESVQKNKNRYPGVYLRNEMSQDFRGRLRLHPQARRAPHQPTLQHSRRRRRTGGWSRS